LKNNNWKKNLMCCGIVLLLACLTVALYPEFRKVMEGDQNYYTQQEQEIQKANRQSAMDYFASRMYVGSYGLYWNLTQKVNENAVLPSSLLLPSYLGDSEEYGRELRESFNEEFYAFYKGYLDEMSQMRAEYYVSDRDSNVILTNTTAALEELAVGTFSELESQYDLFWVWEYNSDGQLTLLRQGGTEELRIVLAQALQSIGLDLRMEEFESNRLMPYEVIMNKPEGMIMVTAIKDADFLSGYYGWNYSNDYLLYEKCINSGFGLAVLVSLAIVTILALLLPFWKSLGIGAGSYGRIPLEALLLLTIWYFYFWNAYEIVGPTFGDSITGAMVTALESRNMSSLVAIGLVTGGNIVVLSFFYGLWFSMVLSGRKLFEVGLRRYLLEYSWTLRLLRYLYRKCKSWLQKLAEVDLTESSNRWLLKILTVNFLILSVLCVFWLLGIMGLAVYSVGLFFFLRRHLKRIKEQYQSLQQSIHLMAEGNLDAEFDTEMGVFEPLKEELVRVQSGFRLAVEEEVRSQNMKTELITNVSHDLKTPLTAIITYINLLKEGTGTKEEQQGYLETLEKKSMRLKQLIEDLFEVSKAVSGNIAVEKASLDVAELVRQAALEMEGLLKASELHCRVSVPEGLVLAELDGGKTYRILENLLGNAAKYSVPGTRVYLTLTQTDSEIRIEVKSVSCFELSHDIDYLKSRFVRGDKARNTEGSGLGLTIVESFTELQGGTLRIEADGDLFKAIVSFPR